MEAFRHEELDRSEFGAGEDSESYLKILITSTSLLPDYGGPAFSVSRLAMALADAGAEVGLWASDRSAANTPLVSATSPVLRLTGTDSEALDRFGDPDILHDNGIWLLHNHRLAVFAEKRGIPRVVSTRGMLEPWAISHKGLKKKIAWRLYQRRDLQQALCHVATGDAEARSLQDLELGVPIAIVPNGVDVPEERPFSIASESEKACRNGRKRTALFLGRIYPIKGLPMLIEAWARVRPDGWLLRIAGPDEAGHQKQVERAVSAAGLSGVVSFTGPVEPQMRTSAFLDADLFILPTHSESFGMVVAEALAHGVPVLTTTAAPWSILRESGCGWSVDATVDGIADGLRQATRLDSNTLRSMGAKGRALVNAKFSWKHVADLMLSTYGAVLTDKMPNKTASSNRSESLNILDGLF
jgi:glycosyltransferase involved in cell wall biosynthesis